MSYLIYKAKVIEVPVDGYSYHDSGYKQEAYLTVIGVCESLEDAQKIAREENAEVKEVQQITIESYIQEKVSTLEKRLRKG